MGQQDDVVSNDSGASFAPRKEVGMNEGEVLKAALEYAGFGWAVFPVHSIVNNKCTCGQPKCGGKHPRTPRGCKDATTDESIIKGWWSRWPDANVAIATGKISNLVVLDIDPKNNGMASARKLIEKCEIPYSCQVMTGGNGYHIYFAYPDGVEVKNTTRLGGLSGIDVRADGGYVVAPPSNHVSGHYRWREGYHYQEVRLAEPSPKLLDYFCNPRKLIDDTKKVDGAQLPLPQNPAGWVESTLGTLSEGNRNDSFAKITGKLHRGGLEAKEIITLLEPHAERAHFPLVELEKEVEGICRRYPNNVKDSPKEELELKPVAFSEMVEPPPQESLIGNLIPKHHVSLMYGDGGHGKSYVALSLGFHIATGQPFIGMTTDKNKVLYCDWELSAEDHARRGFSLARGMGLTKPPENIYYLQMNQSLGVVFPKLRQMICHMGIGMVIIDSLGLAAGVDPESAKQIIPIFADIKSLGVTSLILDHQSKLQSGQMYRSKTPFGSAFKGNLSRAVFQLRKTGDDDTGMKLVLTPTKSNFGALSKHIPLRLVFDKGEIRIEESELTVDELEYLSVSQQILEVLRAHEQLTKAEIAEMCDLNPNSVANELSKLKRTGRVIVKDEKKGNAPIYDLPENQKGGIV